jgi:hypothetical protein
MVNSAAAMAPELDPAAARIGNDEEESLKTRATPRWYGSNIPAPLNDIVQNFVEAVILLLDVPNSDVMSPSAP